MILYESKCLWMNWRDITEYSESLLPPLLKYVLYLKFFVSDTGTKKLIWSLVYNSLLTVILISRTRNDLLEKQVTTCIALDMYNEWT